MKAPGHRTIWAAAALVGSMSFAAFAVTTVVDNAETEDLQDNDARQDSDIVDNQQAIEDISATLAGVTELVEFVRDLQEQPQGSGTQEAVAQIMGLLCASSDPVRQEACRELNEGN